MDPADLEGKGRWIAIGEGAAIQLLIGLQRSVVIAGQVNTEDGRPLSGIGILAARFSRTDGHVRMQRMGAPAFSDDQGRYRLHHLPAGSYVVVAAPMGDVASVSGLGLAYYPGHRDVARAEILELAPGAELLSVDIRMQPGEHGAITGAVTGIPSDWAGGRAAVSLMPRSGMQFPVAIGMTDPSGRYEFDRVPEGDYQILAWGPAEHLNFDKPPRGPSTRYGSSAVAVRGRETSTIDLVLSPGLRVEARWPATKPCLGIETLRMRLENGWPEWWVFEGHSDGSGVAWDPAPAGKYRFDIPELEKSCTFAGVQTSPDSAPAHRISVESPVVLTPVTAASSGEISGTVQRAGMPAQGAIIVLSTAADRAFSVETSTDRVGQFRFERLPPGAYRIIAVPNAGPDVDPTASFLRPAQRRVILEPGQKLSVELNAPQGN
ncbi:MAG: carboxypeptidase regulatory-like domain-containing protein [Acidobacteria bacterium]|nr:carboxypeptidase regulatory-like domain-containing protein [Acidobacteriota bacterium]